MGHYSLEFKGKLFDIDSDNSEDIDNIFSDMLDEEIVEALSTKNPCWKIAKGFVNMYELDDDVFKNALDILNNEYENVSVKIFYCKDDCIDAITNDDNINNNLSVKMLLATDIIKDVIEKRYQDTQQYIDTGIVAIQIITNFLIEGYWQYGLRKPNGEIIRNVACWPQPKIENGIAVWEENGETLNPVIWFGLQNKEPEECWSIEDKSSIHQIHEIYVTPISSETEWVEDWKEFWFCKFWCLDWNNILDDGLNIYKIWMFSECGLDEPKLEFDTVRENCPIILLENDSIEQLLNKVNKYCLDKQLSL